MASIKTFSVKDEDQKIYNEFQELKWRDKKSESELIMQAIKEYFENHKDGNDQMTLDDPIVCTPAFFRDSKTIRDYFSKCNNNEFENHKFKLQEWIAAFKMRFGESPI